MDVMIADADEEARLTLSEAIVAVIPNAVVREVTNGIELQRAISHRSPDILFIDTILPGTNAEMIMTWRETAGASSVVVLVADLLKARWPSIARRLNAYDVLLKPLSESNVRNVLQASAFLCRDLTLLLVEPGSKTRQVAQQAFAGASFRLRVIEAKDGRSAVKSATTQPVDLVVIGPSVPDMPPSEVACRIDALGTGARIVMIVGQKDDSAATKLSLFGASTFLRLPFTSMDVDRLVYETYGLWQPYLLEALRREYDRREKDAAAVSAAG